MAYNLAYDLAFDYAHIVELNMDFSLTNYEKKI